MKSGLVKIVSGMRRQATELKAHKEQWAENAVVSVLGGVSYGLDLFMDTARMMTEVMTSVAVSCRVLTQDKPNQMLRTLVSNTLQDAGNRWNEAATLVEVLAQDPAVDQALDQLVQTCEGLGSSSSDKKKAEEPEPEVH